MNDEEDILPYVLEHAYDRKMNNLLAYLEIRGTMKNVKEIVVGPGKYIGKDWDLFCARTPDYELDVPVLFRPIQHAVANAIVGALNG